MFHVKHPMGLSDLYDSLAAENFILSKEQVSRFETYIELIHSWSRRYHIISKNDLNDIVERHILPCLFLYYVMDKKKGATVLDIGSGAGFPGIILKIMQPDLKIVLIDSMKKKYLFLQEAADILEIDCTIICERVEQYSLRQDINFDFIVNRAVASLGVLWKWTRPLLKAGGIFYAMKGGNCRNEMNEIDGQKTEIEIIDPPEAWVGFSGYLQGKVIVKISSH
jgi:16S rRNA (guanine527-N7)-methyltransferase